MGFNFIRYCLALTPVVLLLAAAPAQAALQVSLFAGAASTTIVDGGSGDFDGLVNGEIEVESQTVGGYTFKFSLTSSNSPGSNELAFVDSNVGRISGTGATTVRVVASSNGFTAPITPPDLEVLTDLTTNLGSASPTNTADVSVRSYIDTSNQLSTIGQGMLVGSASATAVHDVSLEDVLLLTHLEAPYTITLVMEATFNQATNNRLDIDGGLSIIPTPEPSTMVVWGAGALGFALLGYRRRVKAKS